MGWLPRDYTHDCDRFLPVWVDNQQAPVPSGDPQGQNYSFQVIVGDKYICEGYDLKDGVLATCSKVWMVSGIEAADQYGRSRFQWSQVQLPRRLPYTPGPNVPNRSTTSNGSI